MGQFVQAHRPSMQEFQTHFVVLGALDLNPFSVEMRSLRRHAGLLEVRERLLRMRCILSSSLDKVCAYEERILSVCG